MNLSQLEDYILRQSRGELSDEEEAALQAWYEASEENRQRYLDYLAMLKAQAIDAQRATFESKRAAAWERLRQAWRDKQSGRQAPFRLWWQWGRYAAVACLAFVLGWYLPKLTEVSEEKPLEAAMQIIETPRGAKTHLTLPDGTQVWLNSGSRLSYSTSLFNKDNRMLSIDGEGYFEVTHNEHVPFILCTTQGTSIRVLGTKFNLKSYSEDRESRVTLLEGSVAVYADTHKPDSYTLRKGEQIVVNERTHAWKVRQVNPTDYTMWTTLRSEDIASRPSAHNDDTLTDMTVPTSTLRNTLFFDEEPLEQIVRDLSRAFNLNILLEPDVPKDAIYYGDFRNNEDIYEIMEVITSDGHLQYRIENNTIIISSLP